MLLSSFGALPQQGCSTCPRSLPHTVPCAPLPRLAHLRQHSDARLVARHQQSVCRAAATAPAGAGKLLATSEISAFIPRSDLMDQLLRWAYIDGQDQGVANFGLPLTVKATYREPEQLWGFTVTVHSREGETLTQLSVRLDEEYATRHEYIGRGADGFPQSQGGKEQVLGKCLEIRKIDDNPVDERLRSVIKGFCQALVAAINKYYAFGSPFVDDAQ